LCTVALATQSKDLQIVGWLMESWLVMDGLKGGVNAFQTLKSFCEIFWPVLYPQADVDDDARLFVFDWIDKTLHDRLLFIEITPALEHIDLRPLTLADWIEAVNFEKISKRSPENKNFVADAESKGKITLNRFRRGLAVAPKQYLQDLYDNVMLFLSTVELFRQSIEPLALEQTPAFVETRDHLTTLNRIIQATLEQRQSELAVVEKTTEVNEQIETVLGNSEIASVSSSEQSNGVSQENEAETIAQRADAYRAIHELGKYLMEIDSHSPAPYLLELIVSWENKKLLQIVSDINEGKSEAHNLLKLLAGTPTNR
jgi:type VI secretion system protein ImpA